MTNVYETPQSDLKRDDEQYEYAGFWIRTGASIIDSLLIVLITAPLLFMVYGSNYYASETFIHGPFDVFINYIFPIAVTLAFWSYKSATPGKMAIKAIIVDAKTGQKPSTAQFVIRYIGYIVSMIPLFLGFLWVAWDSKKQGWHDKLAGTVVIRNRNRGTEEVSFPDQ